MIKSVLFDLDETLFDRTQTLRRFLRSQFETHSNLLGDVDEQTWVSWFLREDRRGKTPKKKLYPDILTAFGADPRNAGVLIEGYYENSTRTAIAMPGMDDVLRALSKRQIRVGIITNGETRLQARTLSALGLIDRVDTVLISEQEGCKKPDRQIFEKAMTALGCAPSHSVFVGDDPEADVLGASNAGLETIWFNPDQRAWSSNTAKNPGLEIQKLEAVLTWLQR